MPRSLTESLKTRLDGCSRVAVLGIGSELRGDDAAGMLVVRDLCARVAGRPFQRLEFEGFEGANAPENVTGFISSFRPTHIVLIDAADIGRIPGECREIAPGEISGTDFSTHTLPLKVVTDYLAQATGAAMMILGIRPRNLDFGAGISPPVRRGVKALGRQLYDTLKNNDDLLTDIQSRNNG